MYFFNNCNIYQTEVPSTLGLGEAPEERNSLSALQQSLEAWRPSYFPTVNFGRNTTTRKQRS